MPNTPKRSIRVTDRLWTDAHTEAERRGETITAAIIRFLHSYIGRQS